MYVSIAQIEQSLSRLEGLHPFFGMSFLVFKKAEIPVGETTEFVFARAAAELLDTYYKASTGYDGYYNPFQPSSVKSRWVAPGYYHQSLQRITTDTFADVTTHPKGSSEWGWRDDYVEGLRRHLEGGLIPAFDLAVWLFRQYDLHAGAAPDELIGQLFLNFQILPEERDELFDVSIPDLAKPWLMKHPVNERQLVRLIGHPPGATPEEGAALERLELNAVGPASHLTYEPSERLNIITGDNSLGKTFLLECIWWALTGEWLQRPAYPRQKNGLPKASIRFSIKTAEGTDHKAVSHFDRKEATWTIPQNRKVLAGLVIYGRHDGSFAVWDPAKVQAKKNVPVKIPTWILLDKQSLWDGVRVNTPQTEYWLCNGLLRDWVQWQVGGTRYEDQFSALRTCLDRLSPSQAEPLVPGEPSRWFPLDSRETPTLKMPYGEIPVQLASAGVQRIVSVAYVLVWAWFEHLAACAVVQKSPQRRVVLLIDEVEAHLHPKWQRVIVPALTDVVNVLSTEITPQIHLATHSPMVMASVETIFNAKTDNLHHLSLAGADVQMKELPFVKRGTADQWLISNVFELRQARSVDAERDIEAAKALQMGGEPTPQNVTEVNARLLATLAPDDEFWPRWRFFAKQYGLEQ